MMVLNPLKGQSPPLWMCQPRGDIPESLAHLPTYQLQPTRSLCLSLAGGLTTPTPVAFSRSPPPCVAHSWSHISSEIWKLTLKPTPSSKEHPLIKWGWRTLQSMTDKSPINENTHTHTPQQTDTHKERKWHIPYLRNVGSFEGKMVNFIPITSKSFQPMRCF